jgi:hypothetical protein
MRAAKYCASSLSSLDKVPVSGAIAAAVVVVEFVVVEFVVVEFVVVVVVTAGFAATSETETRIIRSESFDYSQ